MAERAHHRALTVLKGPVGQLITGISMTITAAKKLINPPVHRDPPLKLDSVINKIL